MPERIVFLSQLELPVAANHPKSSIRKQEFDAHAEDQILHLPENGEVGQFLAMTPQGPRWVWITIRGCPGNYGTGCRIEIMENEVGMMRQGIDINVVREIEII